MVTISYSDYFLYLSNVYMPLKLPLLFVTVMQFLFFFFWNKVELKKLPLYILSFVIAFMKAVTACFFIIFIADQFRVGTVAVMLLSIHVFMRFLRYLGVVYVLHKRIRLWLFLMNLYVISKYVLHAMLTNEWFMMVSSRILLVVKFIIGLFLGEKTMTRFGLFVSGLLSIDPYFVFYCIALFIFINEQFFLTDDL